MGSKKKYKFLCSTPTLLRRKYIFFLKKQQQTNQDSTLTPYNSRLDMSSSEFETFLIFQKTGSTYLSENMLINVSSKNNNSSNTDKCHFIWAR